MHPTPEARKGEKQVGDCTDTARLCSVGVCNYLVIFAFVAWYMLLHPCTPTGGALPPGIIINVVSKAGMTRKRMRLLCASLCLAATTLPAWAATPPSGKAQTPKKETRTTAGQQASTTGEHLLLADRLEIKNRLSKEKQRREADLKAKKQNEDLEAPASELYGEESWGSHVNPFAGMSVNIPDRQDIDLQEFVMPIATRQITSNYGYRHSFGRMHYGTDLKLSHGDTVRAAFSGKVRIKSYEGGGYGNYVVIRHPNGLETVYGHMSRSIVREGTVVRAGDPIGLGGSTGRSTGPHLHFEARFMGIPIDPSDLFDFQAGVPRYDVFAFVKGAYRTPRSFAVAKAAAKPKKSGESNEEQFKTHRIKKGETVRAIAAQYGVSVSKLCRTNGISARAKLSTGRTLRIPS